MTGSINLKNIKKIHFIGIGGIGMSAIAEIMMNQGFSISGSDLKISNITTKLENKGANIYIGHSVDNVKDSDLVVYTSAVGLDNPELSRAKEIGISILDRAEMLGLLMKNYKNSIAISGAHGKTTTTSMSSLIFNDADLNPTILVGGELKQIGGNVKIGSNDFLITEACEYKENFLKFRPTTSVILNIDEDHLDYFEDLNHIISTFNKFANLIPKKGYLFLNYDDYNVRRLASHVDCNVVSFGMNVESSFMAKNLTFDGNGYPNFEVFHNEKKIGSFKLNLPGQHNVYNALGAIALAYTFGIPADSIKSTLEDFKGTNRRFDILGKKDDIIIIDDYAHHPTEIKATLDAVKKYPHNRVWSIFQPHTYTRTKSLLLEFAASFKDADKVIITDIYAAREKDNGDIHSRDLVELIEKEGKDVVYIDSFDSIVGYLKNNAHPRDVVLTMGAGNIYEIGKMFLEA